MGAQSLDVTFSPERGKMQMHRRRTLVPADTGLPPSAQGWLESTTAAPSRGWSRGASRCLHGRAVPRAASTCLHLLPGTAAGGARRSRSNLGRDAETGRQKLEPRFAGVTRKRSRAIHQLTC